MAPASVLCPHCKHSNPSGTLVCLACHSLTQSPHPDQATIVMGLENTDQSFLATPTFAPGVMIGERYEIVALLGTGGMGAVYKATDRELDRTVALKVIRPEFASHPQALQRFKQEIILARQISHKNVIRIYDLGTAPGVVFITMEYIEGEDLASHAEKQKLAPEQSARIIRDVCAALEAAHGEAVIHRDLKPQNIMLSQRGKVSVMDFGLARSVEQLGGVTQVGALMGTPAYMSPEQAEGKPLDARSDLFALGIIFYELLTGKVPYEAETMLASLVKRIRDVPPEPITVDPSIPKPISDIVAKCLVVDPARRYQSASEIIADLDAALDPPKSSTAPSLVSSAPALPAAPSERPPRPLLWRVAWGAAFVLVAAMVGAGLLFFWPSRSRSSLQPHKPVSVLVADVENTTGDSVFDGTLEPMFSFAIEQAGFVTSFNRGQARKLAAQLEYSTDKLDESSSRLIAVRQGLNVVLLGSLARVGDGYTVSVTAIDAVTGKRLVTAHAKASSKEEVLAQIPKLVLPVRKALGDSTPKSVQLAAAETFTAGNIAAAHEYALAQDLMFNAEYEKAKAGFIKASQLDPNFGRAYASIAVASLNLGQRYEGAKYFKLAMSHLDRMTERERFRTRGAYYIMTGNDEKCVEEFRALVAQFPSDPAGHNNLALCEVHLRRLPDAITEMRGAIEISPNYAMLRNNLALFAAYSGDFQTAQAQAQATQKLNPSYAKSYVATAFAQLLQGRLQDVAETYKKLAALGPQQRSRADTGLADLAVYQGRFDDAIGILQTSAAADLSTGDKETAAGKFAALASAQMQKGQLRNAVTAAENAVANTKSPNINFLAARVFAAAGEASRARAIAGRLASELAVEPQVYGKLIEGEIDLKENNARQAIRLFSEANRMLNTWIGHFDLGRAYFESEAFAEADSEFDECIRRRGEVLALFLDEKPTFGYFPPTYYYVGRVREALKNAGSAESYRAYVAIRGQAGQDPLVAEINRRIQR